MEKNHEQGCDEGVAGVPAGTTPAGGAWSVRGSRPAGECRDLELPGVSARTPGAGVPAAAAQADRTAAEGVASASGEELAVARSETSASESGAPVARALERRLCG